jgi:hypothetical protein
MSTTGPGRSDADQPTASDVAGRVDEAGFVRIVGATTGDGLAAGAVLARTLAALDRPFQVSLAGLAADAARGTDADCTVAVGRSDASADLHLPGTARPASETAFAVARELGVVGASGRESGAGGDDLLALALAGVHADGRVADSPVTEFAVDAGFERRPGLALPTTDLADGLAHSTLVHLPVSGDRDAAADLLAEFDLPTDATDLEEEGRRKLASLVAVEAVGDDDVPPRGGDAVERICRPFAGGPVETVGGYADVLDAVARERPGTGIALALGQDVRDDAVEAWRDHAGRAHAAVREADTGRYDGLFVARPPDPDAPVGTVARLVHAYRSPEPVTLVAVDGTAAVVADDRDLDSIVRTAAQRLDGTGEATGTTGRARFDAEASAFVAATREALA